ncbi:MAG: LysR family transcriptional regulator [Deltaproteobacteria bacterium]|nr:LysR family transcriptional regulator [Nannocystaceae bacterium]
MASQLRWDDLQLFLFAYRTRSLTRAAANMGLNQSTTSRRLTALEESLGASLFQRTPQGLVPTLAAERMLSAAERAEAAADDAQRAIDGSERVPEGEVRIAVSDGVSVFGLAPLVPALRERYPRIVLTLVVSNSFADLSRREADLAIRLTRPDRGDLVSRRLLHGGYALFASRSLGPQRGEGLVGWDEVHRDLHEARWETSSGLPIVVRGSTVSTRIALARAGCGAIALPRVLGSRLEDLVEVDGSDVPLHTEAWLVVHAALRDVPRIRAVWDFVVDGFAELGGDGAG